MILKNTIQHQYITVEEESLSEHQAILIFIDQKILAFINVYFPPGGNSRARCIMVAEIGRLIASLKRKHCIYQFFVVGDFNSPNIKWEFDDENLGAMINTTAHINTYETKLIQLSAQHQLDQLNSIPNQRGTFLDLIFTTNKTNCKVTRVSLQELMDYETQTHFRNGRFAFYWRKIIE